METELDTDTAYRIDGHEGIAWTCEGPELEADEDTYWTGIKNPTGRYLFHMIGDDRTEAFDPDEVTDIGEDYCAGCGQTGCYAYGDRED